MTSPAPKPGPHEPDEPPRHRVGPMTFEEYLAFEEESDIRHEYIDGYAYPMEPTAMSGGTLAHDQIIANVHAQLWLRTRGTECRTHTQGFKLQTPDGRAYYPDAMVSCAPMPPNDALYLDNPCLVVEVLSPSTERYDFTDKRASYVEVPSLGAYFIVETVWRAVHRHYRGDDGVWRQETIAAPDAVVPLPCPAGGSLTLDEIYEGVDVPPEPPAPPRLRRVYEPAGAYVATGTGYAWVAYEDADGPEPGDA